MKTNSNIKPSVFVNLNNGFWHYNYNIIESVKDTEYGQVTNYDYDTVRIEGSPTKDTVTKAVIAESYDVTKELGIINDYRRYELELMNESAKEVYVEYLNNIQRIKDMVKVDIEFFN